MEDRAAKEEFEAVTLQYLDALYRFALLLAKERAQAEDLVQDTYLRAHRYYSRFQCGTNYKAWLFTILRNIFINECHHRAREVSLGEIDLEAGGRHEDPPTAFLCSTGSAVERGIFRADIEKSMKSLPERLRAVIILKDLEGFDYKEIAEILGCPVGTVMSRLWRSRSLLKKSLKGYYQVDRPQKDHAKLLRS